MGGDAKKKQSIEKIKNSLEQAKVSGNTKLIKFYTDILRKIDANNKDTVRGNHLK